MYYLRDYIWYLIAIGAVALLASFASARVNSTFKKYSDLRCRAGLSGADVAARLLSQNGASDIRVGHVSGKLSDHYHPAHGTVNLSDSTYSSNSVSAVAVAAHEIGHVMQKKNGYFLYNVRTTLVPVVNVGSRLAMPLVLIGLLLDAFVALSDPDTGFYIAMTGVVLYGTALLFALVTLPVELDASRRAVKMLRESYIISDDQVGACKKVLRAAAATYLVSVLAALVQFLRFLLYVLSLFGRRNSRR